MPFSSPILKKQYQIWRLKNPAVLQKMCLAKKDRNNFEKTTYLESPGLSYIHIVKLPLTNNSVDGQLSLTFLASCTQTYTAL